MFWVIFGAMEIRGYRRLLRELLGDLSEALSKGGVYGYGVYRNYGGLWRRDITQRKSRESTRGFKGVLFGGF